MMVNTSYPRNILEQLGIDPKTFVWQELAGCNGMPTDLFFDKYEERNNKRRAVQIDNICLHCPVTKECFFAGVEGQETGVWGGFYLDRGEVDRSKNAHKTEDIVRELSARIYG